VGPAVLRSGVITIRAEATRALADIFRMFDTADAVNEALRDVMPALVAEYGAAAAALAADWYDDVREAAGVRGSFTAIPAEVGDRGVDALIGWGLAPMYGGSGPAAALALLDGGMIRRISDVARETVMGSAVADPQADGWQRFAAGGCAFCQMLAGRGAVYTAATANFASHDKCRCTAAVAFRGEPRPVKPYTPSLRSSTDADRERVRAYLRENPAV